MGLLNPESTTVPGRSLMPPNITSTPIVPSYASDCNESQYSSACGCIGAMPSSTVTVFDVSLSLAYNMTLIRQDYDLYVLYDFMDL
jgi:hypothetical protein